MVVQEILETDAVTAYFKPVSAWASSDGWHTFMKGTEEDINLLESREEPEGSQDMLEKLQLHEWVRFE